MLIQFRAAALMAAAVVLAAACGSTSGSSPTAGDASASPQAPGTPRTGPSHSRAPTAQTASTPAPVSTVFTAPPSGQGTGPVPSFLACQVLSLGTWKGLTANGAYSITWIWTTASTTGTEVCNSNGPQLSNGMPDATVLLTCGKYAKTIAGPLTHAVGRVYGSGQHWYELSTASSEVDVQASWDSSRSAKAALAEAVTSLQRFGCSA
jgi:hypothetical protein